MPSIKPLTCSAPDLDVFEELHQRTLPVFTLDPSSSETSLGLIVTTSVTETSTVTSCANGSCLVQTPTGDPTNPTTIEITTKTSLVTVTSTETDSSTTTASSTSTGTDNSTTVSSTSVGTNSSPTTASSASIGADSSTTDSSTSIETNSSTTASSTKLPSSGSTVTDTECPESKTTTVPHVTVTECPGEAAGCTQSRTENEPAATVTECPGGSVGCTGKAPGANPTSPSPSIIEVFTTETLTQTSCPHTGKCTTLVTSVVHTGTGTPVLPTGGPYVNGTEKAQTSSVTKPLGTTSKSPSGPSVTATYSPNPNGAQHPQVIVGQIIALGIFMIVCLEVLL